MRKCLANIERSQLGLREVSLAELDAENDDETLGDEEDSEDHADGVEGEAVVRPVAAGPALHLILPSLDYGELVGQQDGVGVGGVGDTSPPPHQRTAEYWVAAGHTRSDHGTELNHRASGELERVKISLQCLRRVSDRDYALYDGGVSGTA